jgi:hypothetical protein
LLTGGLISAAGNITGATVSATANITGGNLLASGLISTAGNITGGNISTAGALSGSNNLLINAPSPASEGAQIVMAWANISGLTGQANSTWNIDVNGTNDFRIFYQNAVGSAAVPFTITQSTNAISMIGSLSVNSNSGATAIVNGAANGVGNIGSSTTYFNTVFAKATSAQYADLAEMYVADADYPPGTVVEFGGVEEITQTVSPCSTAVAGVISTNPSYIMNSGQQGKYVLPVALTGRVPCRVQGPVSKGDVLISSNLPGVAQRIGSQDV